MLTHKSKARKFLTPGPSKKPRAAGEASAPPRMKEKLTSPPWWLDLTRIAHEKVDGLTRIVAENDPDKNYMLHVKRTGEEVLLNVNLACRHCLDLMFSGNYAEAVFEHENAHLVTPTKHSYWEIDPNSLSHVRNDVRMRYHQFSDLLAEMIRDSIANAVLESQTLEQFLEFEVRKIEDHEARIPFVIDNLLWVTEVKLCADMRHLGISGLEKIASAILRQSNVLQDIQEIAYALFKKAWLASEKASQKVDLSSETQTLREYVLRHIPILLEPMRT